MMSRVASRLVASDVSLCRPCSKVSVLSDLDLELVEGHVTALVGESGSGKTTIAMLLERFYDPTTGCPLPLPLFPLSPTSP